MEAIESNGKIAYEIGETEISFVSMVQPFDVLTLQ